MIILGVILLILGAILDIGVLITIGIIVACVGLALLLVGTTGAAVGGRRHWY